MATAGADFLCVLRASSRANVLDALLETFLRGNRDNAWRAGSRDRLGRIRSRDGFNLSIAEGSDWKHVMRATRLRLRAIAPMIQQGRKLGASFELDFGVMVGRSFHTARFDPEDLKLLSALGIELCVSAYPVGEQPRARTRRRAGGPQPKSAQRQIPVR